MTRSFRVRDDSNLEAIGSKLATMGSIEEFNTRDRRDFQAVSTEPRTRGPEMAEDRSLASKFKRRTRYNRLSALRASSSSRQ